MLIDDKMLSEEKNRISAQVQQLQKSHTDIEAALRRGEGAIQVIDMLLYRLSQEPVPEIQMTEKEFAEAIKEGENV